jgi:hypothetical protein
MNAKKTERTTENNPADGYQHTQASVPFDYKKTYLVFV